MSVMSGWLMLRPDGGGPVVEGPLVNCEVSTREPWMLRPRVVDVGCAYAITTQGDKVQLRLQKLLFQSCHGSFGPNKKYSLGPG